MSYRDSRKLAEILQVLGYPRLVSIDNFRKPNFPLVAEILKWLINRFDPSVEIPLNIGSEQERVAFIKNCVQSIATQAFIKLNAKKLYTADSSAVEELLKMALVLYEAAKQSETFNAQGAEDDTGLTEEILLNKSNELRRARLLVSTITQKGATLSDMLEKETELREQRSQALEFQSEIMSIEKALQEEIKKIEQEIESVNFKIQNVASDEANLDVKIEKKQQELERYQKRFEALQLVRPAYMDEYEKLEEELMAVYEKYVAKYRNMMYLELQLEGYEKEEIEKIQARNEQVRKMIEQMKDDEALLVEDGSEGDLEGGITMPNFEYQDDEDDNPKEANQNRTLETVDSQDSDRARRSLINTTTASKRTATGKVRVFGNILAEDKDDDSLDSELSLDADDDPSELDSDDERELMNIKDINSREKGNTNDYDDF